MANPGEASQGRARLYLPQNSVIEREGLRYTRTISEVNSLLSSLSGKGVAVAA